MKQRVVLIDLAGRQIATMVETNKKRVHLASGPIGAFVFTRTDEKVPVSGEPIFRQLDPSPVTKES